MGRFPRIAHLLAVLTLLATSASGAVRARRYAEAYFGEPFGVGCVEVSQRDVGDPGSLGWSRLAISEKNHRALYPAVATRALGELVDGALEQAHRPAARIVGELLDTRGRARVYFLFLGREPLELTIQLDQAQSLRVAPVENAALHRRLLQAWWRHYTAGPGLLGRVEPGLFGRVGDAPEVVANYLRAMLAQRLALPWEASKHDSSWQNRLAQELRLLADTESLRVAISRERFARRGTPEPADQPLPQAIEIPTPELPELDPSVSVEPLASRVPEQCFYIRFGSFGNFLWFQDTLERIGGELQNLLVLRGVNHQVRQRFQTQLAVETTALARLLGDALIADVAIVGTDLSVSEGGCYGLLFQAKNNLLLGADLVRQRRERAEKIPGASEQRVRIGGREVSLWSSPDGRVRSYYAADGDFHLITTSRFLVERFLATGSGSGSLARTPEFRYARSLMPPDRNDTVFVYLSSRFFGNWVSPGYRIERKRRLEALADLELAQLALLASATEGRSGETIDELVAAGFLPPGFGTRPDGTRTLLVEGNVRDSARGARGAFLPIPDHVPSRVTRSEADAYRQFADWFRSRWERLDPVAIGIRRQAIQQDRERVTIDLRIAPFAPKHAEILSHLVGRADPQRLAPIPDDPLAVEMILPGYRVFGAVRQIGFGPEGLDELRFPLVRLRNLLVGYLGTSDETKLAGWLPFRKPQANDAKGFTRGDLGLWRYQTSGFTLYSFQREVLEQVAGQLHLEPAERPAQLRLRIGDWTQSRLAPFINQMAYARSRATSLGNLRLLHQMTQQFHIPARDALAAAETILDGKLTCPLGGEYVYRQREDKAGFWTSTALEGTARAGVFGGHAPPGFLAQPLSWLRGMELDATLEHHALSAHVELDIHWPAKP